MIRFTLPVPPSTNNLFATGKTGKRFITDKYTSWRSEAYAEMMIQRVGQAVPKAPVSVSIVVPDTNGKRDIDNNSKAVLDALKTMGVLVDDSDKYVRSLHVSVGAPADRCIVEIEALTQTIPHYGKVS